MQFNPMTLVNALIYALAGIAIFALAFIIVDKCTPYDLWKEINEDRNIALAILVGAMSLGMCIIIAAAIH